MSKARRTGGWRPRFKVRTLRLAGIVALLSMVALGVAQGNEVTPTNQWVDLYGNNCTFAGVAIPTGSHVAVRDSDGIQCGAFEVAHAGAYGIMPCYGDDPLTSGVEGPSAGEPLRFTINGVAATPLVVARNGTPAPSGTPAIWTQTQDRLQVDLSVPPRPEVTVKLVSAQLRLDWQEVGQDVGADATQYEVWRSAAPYFAPGDAGAERAGAVTPTGDPMSWSVGDGVGDPEQNYAYRVRSLNAMSLTVGISQAVAEFDFAIAP